MKFIYLKYLEWGMAFNNEFTLIKNCSTQVEKKSSGSKLGEMLLRTLKMLATLQMQGHCRKHLLLGSFTR